jgi:LysB family phage lysis regulatory protein
MFAAATNWITRVAGPKALLGVVAALVATLALAAWQWREAHAEAVTATERLEALRGDLSRQEQIIGEQRAELAAFDAAMKAQREREQKARARAAEAEQRLRALEQSDEQVREWSDGAVPDGVRRWLREPANGD